MIEMLQIGLFLLGGVLFIFAMFGIALIYTSFHLHEWRGDPEVDRVDHYERPTSQRPYKQTFYQDFTCKKCGKIKRTKVRSF